MVVERCGAKAAVDRRQEIIWGRVTGRRVRFSGVVLVLLLLAACGRGTQLSGTSLDAAPAPGFSLTNQFGEEVSLADLRGKVVVLTFLYTSCPDTCPLITSKLAQVQSELGEHAQDLAFVVVSVDPKRDTVGQVRRYLEKQGYERQIIFLTGTEAELKPVWQDYGIGVISQPPAEAGSVHYEVAHVDALYIIDKAGRQRTLLQDDFQVADLARDLTTLLRE